VTSIITAPAQNNPQTCPPIFMEDYAEYTD